MRLNELSPAPGSVKKRHRVGRGPGSGWGKTAGRGAKGQRSRSGFTMPPWFEGGQMPLQRRVPKRGFYNHFRKVYALVNIGQLEDRFDDGAKVTEAELMASGLVKKRHDGIKLLGQGELKKKLTIEVAKASGSAVAKVEAAGGSVTLTDGQGSEKIEE
jgi:large subunit ribosomal protein L15